MSAINNTTNQLLQSQLANIQTQNEIRVGVLKKSQDAAKQEGQAVLKLLDAAINMANPKNPSLGVQASGLGKHLDMVG